MIEDLETVVTIVTIFSDYCMSYYGKKLGCAISYPYFNMAIGLFRSDSQSGSADALDPAANELGFSNKTTNWFIPGTF